MINDLPTVFEVVSDRKPVKDKPNADSGSKSRGSTKVILTIILFGYFSIFVSSILHSFLATTHGK